MTGRSSTIYICSATIGGCGRETDNICIECARCGSCCGCISRLTLADVVETPQLPPLEFASDRVIEKAKIAPIAEPRTEGEFIELCEIEVAFYQPRQQISGALLLQRENDFWWFADPDNGCVWDALVDPDVTSSEMAQFATLAGHVTFSPVINPEHVYPMWLSYLDENIDLRGETDTFEGVWPDIWQTIKRLTETSRRGWSNLSFIGVFRVGVARQYGEDGNEGEFVEDVEFLGELDFTKLASAVVV